MQIKNKYWLLLFFIAALLNLYHTIYPSFWINMISKPLLTVLLACFFFTNTGMKTKFEKFILLGLGVSCLGDTALIFQGKSELFFLLGLALFLIVHFLYLKAFLCLTSLNTGYIKKHKWPIVVVLMIFLGSIIFYWSALPGGMKIPFLCYSFAISLMLLSSIHVFGDIPTKYWQLIFIGAVLFIISDSLIALTKFKEIDLGINGFLIMLTYILSQFLICYGSLKATFYCRFEAKDSLSSSLKNILT